MSLSLARKLLMTELQAKKSRRGKVKERATSGVCLIDDCGGPGTKRGLCARHRNQFYNAMAGLTPEKKLLFEEDMIREGLILPAQAIRKYKHSDNPFKSEAS